MSQFRNIERLFGVVNRRLFYVSSTLSYSRTLEALDRLAQEILRTETDESVWNIGQFTGTCLDSLIVGAYWFLAENHGGQGSLEYRVLCRLGEIYKPGMTSGPEADTSEMDVYTAMGRLQCETQ